MLYKPVTLTQQQIKTKLKATPLAFTEVFNYIMSTIACGVFAPVVSLMLLPLFTAIVALDTNHKPLKRSLCAIAFVVFCAVVALPFVLWGYPATLQLIKAYKPTVITVYGWLGLGISLFYGFVSLKPLKQQLAETRLIKQELHSNKAEQATFAIERWLMVHDYEDNFYLLAKVKQGGMLMLDALEFADAFPSVELPKFERSAYAELSLTQLRVSKRLVSAEGSGQLVPYEMRGFDDNREYIMPPPFAERTDHYWPDVVFEDYYQQLCAISSLDDGKWFK
jgi:hypothetical protein